MKKLMFSAAMILAGFVAFACPACEKQQPALLKGITHGAGPDGNADYVIVAFAVVIVLLTLFFSVKFLVKPGEQSQKHIKRLILNCE